MKIVRFQIQDMIEYGVIKNQIIYPVVGSIFGSNIQINDTRPIPSAQVKILPPTAPTKIICPQGNFKKHNEEMKRAQVPDHPIFFFKPTTALIGPEEIIRVPEGIEGEVHYEAELAAVIKKPCFMVKEREIAQYILGYTILNDVTARAYKNLDGNYFRAKSFDTFAPMGPCIETQINPLRTRIQLRLNNEIKQQANTEEMIYSLPTLVSFVSKCMTLLPGDIVTSGTPEGVGALNAGDIVEIDIEKLGCLRNYVK